MATDTLKSNAPATRPTIFEWFLPVPAMCFAGLLVTDIVYWRTADMMWADFSAWLVTAGVIMGLLVFLAGLIDWASGGWRAARRPAWPGVIGYMLVFIVSVFNALIHSRDGWTSVVPTGLILSASAVLLLLVTAAVDRARPRAGS
ncbi:hypothetical protein C5L14_29515 [Labrys okinawensis]|uniref:DUF2231 domain-containing protein n=1 Tax=Labrys okinawensis TaxID=346911 RepID=A0A2S9Q3Q6_9HYPH|nr:DUF2231 domain-containing protein [Labrys okinawensis]PRH84001.1 hypothetical protein C5L14_29515 [Labrys okinawensis]